MGSDGKTTITKDFIADKMQNLKEVQDQLNFLECACESGGRICNASIDHAQSVIDKINALSTDYQDKFKAEIPKFKRQKQNLRGNAFNIGSSSNENNYLRNKKAKRGSSIADMKRKAYSK